MANSRRTSPSDPMPAKSSVEETLMNSLRYSGLDRTHLMELMSAISKLGLRPTRGFPYGIPYVEGIEIEATLNAKSLGSLISKITAANRVDNIRIFPKGIPNPQVFDAKIQFR